ncbi:hypothetical protein AMATHDRAFT_44700 [Amanita thiersii Skay4041]|uniref:Elongin-A n=1 Tax=Amanita thiersii Skay4041 TaxID=703135 RepID=A0A2A9NT41_9AGAR|nr:hypothetical protein AMATHDRAFT_44700 [Amanita thiersii Skay4041]
MLDPSPPRSFPSLVSLCHRVAGAHVDSITSLGSEIRYVLVKPILEKCSAEHLLRIEDASPHLQSDTHELWMDLCIKKFPAIAERFLLGEEEGPETWKERYFAMQQAETKRLEELGSRLRSQRLEAEERKKGRKVKFTDRVPPPKRPRNSWNTSQPKTLFQKTRFEASKIQKTVYNARIIPPMPTAKNYTLNHKVPAPLLPTPPQSVGQSSRVTVNTVRRPLSSVSATSTPTPNSAPSSSSPLAPSSVPASADRSPPASALTTSRIDQSSLTSSSANTSIVNLTSHSPPSSPPVDSSSSAFTRPSTAKPPKKDPMACLFLPKHRAHSQRPTKS